MDIKFAMSVLFFWVKGEVSVDSRFVRTNLSNTILGFIPAGRDSQSIPLKNISSSTTSTSYNIKALIGGAILSILALSMLSDSFFIGIILLIIGVNILCSGIQIKLIIEKGGSPYVISVPFFEQGKILNINNAIHQALSDDTDKTDLNMFFDKKIK
ncbi:MAG: hypothetical protein E7A11_16905 [Clostridium sp.]|uniref:hypothetical protein n=1 Tax=Clostridium TaxID=1485 RepID=UPI000C078825|nr:MULTISPECIES: hypothetical protein [Clostridium]MBS5928301.1 hypothetical protein [Clostridium sp.]MDB2104955.1 hypothetical protein [Clostridium paraputrificum]MDU1034195.1 hypothetical protein [Clostridium sp.]MDU1077200.1 hypothetical protein [Clostridium sp.]MDU1126937.1 hypothetical protein [Clostridium sp.]